ncbi:Dyp-type peroxidase domain-containing protein [Nocardia brevicatena]|uniref:Dyp-type peroxidase domain-containing protein n=1 Tax=Nocardia brevicatena TaxID=37327 RepID=UPI00031DD1A4|nr:Dyp-type peroxidase domain-containing protein [Nocardia brevicatena]
MTRRNDDDGARPSNPGPLFEAYQRDIDAQFLSVQRRTAEFDVLNRWTTSIGSAVFIIPPDTEPYGFIGETRSPTETSEAGEVSTPAHQVVETLSKRDRECVSCGGFL